MSMFSMASMTDVIFLLLIFFMVTSTFVSPSALEVNLPQSSQTTSLAQAHLAHLYRLAAAHVVHHGRLAQGERAAAPARR